jgi:hypothetical protein
VESRQQIGCRNTVIMDRAGSVGGQYETWFNANVKPNVPGEIKQEVIEVHAVLQP